jgi:glycosyltransferase involved in cell wall biosynthesis
MRKPLATLPSPRVPCRAMPFRPVDLRVVTRSPMQPPAPLPELARPLRVLFINDTSRNGGPGRTLYYILKFADASRMHKTVLLPRPGVVSELLSENGIADELLFESDLVENIMEPWDRAIEREDFEVAPPKKLLRAAGNVFRGGRGFFRLAKLVREGRYDAIFCNGTTACFAGGGLSAMTGVPSLWHCFYTSVGAPIRPLHSALAASTGVASICCVSRATTVLYPHCTEKVHLTHDAIDVVEFAAGSTEPRIREEFGWPADAIVVGSQGRILPKKGYVEFVRAAHKSMTMLDEGLRRRVRFIAFGDTPQDVVPDHLEECRALVRELGLEGTFVFPGFRSDVKPYVREFDVSVVPSIYEDPLPRAVLEAMALGKPVCVFDVGGMGEMVRDGYNGALISGRPADVNGLADAIARYVRDPELRAKHGAASRHRAETEFDSRPHAARLQRELERIVLGRNP